MKRSTRKAIRLAFMVSMCIALASALVLLVVVLWPGYGETPMTSAPNASPSQVSSPTPQTVSPSPSVTPSVTPAPSPTMEPMRDIAGVPIHITISQGATKLVDADISVITLDGSGMLVPPAGKAGVYYSKSDWNTIPGDLDAYRGIVVGHDVKGTGARDVFYELGRVKTGDKIILTYRLKSGSLATAEFTVTSDAESAPKGDVVHARQYKYLWQPAKAGRYLSVLSCDLSKAAPGQHSRNNWIVNAIRTK